MPLEGAARAGTSAGLLLAACRERRIPVCHVQHISIRSGAGFFLPDTDGALIHQSVQPLPEERIFQKNYPNSFRETGIDEHLKSLAVGKLIIAGMMTHMCIDATVRAAFDLGYQCTLVQDACATKDLQLEGREVAAEAVHTAFIAALGSVYCKVAGCDEIIAELST